MVKLYRYLLPVALCIGPVPVFAEEPVYSVTINPPQVSEDIYSDAKIPASPEEPRHLYLSGSHDEGNTVHVILKNVSSRPHLLENWTGEPRLIEQLSFEIKRGTDKSTTVYCGHPAGRCFRNFATNYILQPDEDYILSIDAKSCDWGYNFRKELEMRAIFNKATSPWKKYILE